MKGSLEKREERRVLELKREYIDLGYKVVVEPAHDALPPFLRGINYTPDLVAQKGEQGLVIEVTSGANTRAVGLAGAVAEAVEKQPGWQFILVLTNPRTTPSVTGEMSLPRVNQLLDHSERMLATQAGAAAIEAAFMFAWAGLEGALRYLLEQEGIKTTSSPRAIFRDAVSLGYLARTDLMYLDSMLAMRNRLVHGVYMNSLTTSEIKRLNSLTRNALHLGDQALEQ